MIYEVYKRISKGRNEDGTEEYYETNTLVEAGEFRNSRVLINQGYLGPPRCSQAKINKFIAKKGGVAGTNTKVAGVTRPVAKKEPKVAINPPEVVV